MGDRTGVASERKKVLVVARSFPPHRTVGGSIRVVKFIKFLPALEWLPVVLTIDDTNEYDTERKQGSAVLLTEIPPEVKVYRTAAAQPTLENIDRAGEAKEGGVLLGQVVWILYRIWHWISQRLLSPDPYVTWLPIAVLHGRKIIAAERVDAILATCPAYSSALIGVLLKRFSGKPLILDFRDDWIDTPFYRSRPRVNRWIERRLERWAVENAARILLVTERSRAAFLARYPEQPDEKFVFLPNGCDLEEYEDREIPPENICKPDFTIIHAGLLLESAPGPYRRSPKAFFQAIHNLQDQHPELEKRLSILFTGRLPEKTWKTIAALDLEGLTHELGDLPTQKLVRQFRRADLLLAINYDGWETIIPGKVYEYWAAGGPPILLLSGPGAARDLVEKHGLGISVDPDDSDAIARAVWEVYSLREAGRPLRLSQAGIEAYDRRRLATRLAQILDCVATAGDAGRVSQDRAFQ